MLKAILGENEYSGSLTFVDGNEKMSRRPIIGYVPQKLDFDYSSPVSVLDVFACTQSNRPVYFSPDKKPSAPWVLFLTPSLGTLCSVQRIRASNWRLSSSENIV